MCVSGLPGAQSWKCSCDVTFSQPKHSFVTMVATLSGTQRRGPNARFSGPIQYALIAREGYQRHCRPRISERCAVRLARRFLWLALVYLGANEDPRHRGERPDLKDKITAPDVLIQAHSASMGMIIYDGDQFPSEYRGDAFAAQHGSWNRAKRTGYKVTRARLKDGVPTGEYDDFMTGFVVNDSSVWARPVGVAVAHDGALLVSEDGNGTTWRVSYRGGP
jgi:hypothetical protein